MTRRAGILAATVAAVCALHGAARAQSFVNFESGQVRPLAMSPDGSRLFAVNTPDNRLAIYDVGAGGLTLAAEVPVGMEPLAVAARSNTEVWVVNHLSDSISIVQIDTGDVTDSRVIRTLHTCDEPRDIVFAGTAGTRAFVTTARRGQHCPLAANLSTQGTARSVVMGFDATNLGAALGGTPLVTLALFGDTPRALAVSPDRSTVYAAVFHSGNQTTTIPTPLVTSPPPNPPGSTTGAPAVGLIVKRNNTTNRWEDERGAGGPNWDPQINFELPDFDVFRINANANPPAQVNSIAGVGTVLFNMAVRPDNGKVYVTNTEAQNHIRFEPVLRGHLAESRITVIDGTTPSPRHLNPHINYAVVPGPPSEIAQSLAFPGDLVFSSDGQTVFVTGFGSGKVGVFDTDDLEAGLITQDQVAVGGGPSGLALDEARDRLYVMNRFDQTISIVGNASNPLLRAETDVVPLRFDPSPAVVRDGRKFLYDAEFSGHGDSACASCHIFGDVDSLAWDLGDPFGIVEANPNPFRVGSGNPFHPMKGPMTTQSLRGMAGAGPMHWRGDRTGGSDPGGDPLDEDAAFRKFNPAFVGLLGTAAQLDASAMGAFTDFILTVVYPPNPIRALDNVATAAQASGENFYRTQATDGGAIFCNTCHVLPMGTDGFSSIEGEPQEFKIAHLRNMYQKVGMFGVPTGLNTPGAGGIPATGPFGNQVRGFGFLHDGSIATVFDFLQADVFQNFTNTLRSNVEAFVMALDTGLRPIVGQQVSATATTFSDANVVSRVNLLVARDDAGDCEVIVKGNLAGVARGWVYVSGNNFRSDRSSEPLINKDTLRGQAATAGQELTYTCVPPGSGTRMGVDRDLDGFFDRTELDAATDPADPASFPGATTTTTTSTTTTTTTAAPTTTTTTTSTTTTTAAPTTTTTTTSTTTTTGGPTTTTTTTSTSTTASTTSSTTTTTSSTTTTTLPPFVGISSKKLTMKDDVVAPIEPSKRKLRFTASTKLDPSPNRIVPPAPTGPGDPSVSGAMLVLANGTGSGERVTVALPAIGWRAVGGATFKGYRYRALDPSEAVQRVTLTFDKLTVRGGGAALAYTLDEANQGALALSLGLSTGTPWCGNVPARLSGNPPSTAANDLPGKFVGQRNVPPAGACPAVP